VSFFDSLRFNRDPEKYAMSMYGRKLLLNDVTAIKRSAGQ